MELKPLFKDIADAIREKDGTSGDIVASTFPERIRAIQGSSITVESIEIRTPPYKTRYLAGSYFDPTGMAVYALFSNGQSHCVDNSYLIFDPSGPLEEGIRAITVSFQWGDKAVTTSLPVIIDTAHSFGVCWDYSSPSSALTRLTPDTDPYGIVNTAVDTSPVPAIGAGEGSSPFDAYLPWSGMEEYNIIDGEIVCKKGANGFSRTEHDTIVYIPEFWYQCIDDAGAKKRYWYISDGELPGVEKHPGSDKYIAKYKVDANVQSISGVPFFGGSTVDIAETLCQNKGSHYYLSDISIWSAIQLLYLIEFADWDSQTKIGAGVYGDSNAAYIPSGATDIMSYHTGRVSDKTYPQIQYRNIEGVYGNAIEMIGGLYCVSTGYYLSPDGENYSSCGAFSAAMSGTKAIKELVYQGNYRWLFLPYSATESPYYLTDSAYIAVGSNRRHVLHGEYYIGKMYGGMFSWYASDGGSYNYGFRFMFAPKRS